MQACGYMYCRLSLGINDAIRNETKDACYWLNSTWFVESCADYSARIAVKSGDAKLGLRHFILACTDQESGQGLRGSKWTGGSHVIRSISEYDALVCVPVTRLLSLKTT